MYLYNLDVEFEKNKPTLNLKVVLSGARGLSEYVNNNLKSLDNFKSVHASYEEVF